MELPDYSGAPMPTRPPFQFSNVVTAVFPLRAQLDSLQRFIDGYLNILPRELGYFRVSMPYVSLMLLDYGKLSAQATNYGWFSQREVLFIVSLEWYKWLDGRWLFHDYATTAPFIYVDAEMSLTLGRTAMGWSKVLVKLSPSLSGWMLDPGGSTVDVALSAQVLGSTYSGARLEERPLLCVRSPTRGSFRQPFAADSALLPWNAWSSWARDGAALSQDLLGMARAQGLAPMHEASTPENALRKARRNFRMGTQLVPWAPAFSNVSVNLKQFRRADDPRMFCFQQVTSGPLTITSFNRGGRLGSGFSDVSGGYSIELTGWPNFPIVDKLGLEAELTKTSGGPDLAVLRPVLPFWYDCNMEYGQTEPLGQRISGESVDTRWHDADGRPYADAASSLPYFNTVTGASSPVMTGPFEFASATFTVYPLLARVQALQATLDVTLNTPLRETGERFEPWHAAGEEHAYVYLAVLDAGEVASSSNSLGNWGALSLTFYVPVKRMRHGELVGVGLVPVLCFASGTTQACTLAELYGIPAVEASFVRRAHAWDGADGLAPRSLLRLDAQSLPALNEGQQARVGALLELIDRGEGAQVDAAPLSPDAETFCRALRGELERKNRLRPEQKQWGRASALALLARDVPFSVYTMKQFRDAGQPDKACYQALVRVPHRLHEVQHLEELERLLHVELYERASLPVLEPLGLIARDTRLADGTLVHTLEAVRPFRMRVAMRLENGEELYSRASPHWSAHARPCAPAPGSLALGLEERISRHHYTHLRSAIAEWPAEARDAQPALELVRALPELDPQAIVESILAREWEDRSTTSSRAQVREGAERSLARNEAGWGSWLEANLNRLAVRSQRDDVLIHWLHRLEYVSLVFDRERARAQPEPAAVQRAFAELSEARWLHVDERLFPLTSMREDQRAMFMRLRDACDDLTTQPTDLTPRDTLRDLSALARALLTLFYPFVERRVEEALDQAAERLRKPDHCLLRSTAGRESDRLFPRDRCWDARWYDGRMLDPRERARNSLYPNALREDDA
ncbi:MAG: hypothetical protein ABW352_12815 [Polyangiales bacterium]